MAAAQQPQQMYVRLKPYNPKRGYKVKRYSVFGIRFDHDRGWYKVDQNVATYLKTVHVDNNDPDSPLAFDVCTEHDAREIVEKERKAALKRGEVASPIDTASDSRLDARSEREERASIRSRAEQVGIIDPQGGGDMTTDDLPKPSDHLPEPASSESTQDLTVLEGVGSSTEAKLIEAGLSTYASIAKADADLLKSILGSKAKSVQKQAKKLAG